MNDADPYTVDCPACEVVAGLPCYRGTTEAARIASRIATLDAQAAKWHDIARVSRSRGDTREHHVARKRRRALVAERDACGTEPHALRQVYANECARRRLSATPPPRSRAPRA